jgi:uncharacterized membrane protein YgdD (TMEM256/DUF423 family)
MILAVMLGAFGAHAIRDMVSAKQMMTWQTASEYHFYHALALIGLGIWGQGKVLDKLSTAAGLVIIAGLVLFSGSLYLLVLTANSRLGMITPIGGILFICGWICWLLSVSLKAPDLEH